VRIVLNTNVLVSAVFFGGVPGRILEAWRDGRIQLVLSPEILDEYQRVGQVLAAQYDGVDLDPFLGLLAVNAEMVDADALTEGVSRDPDDDKFLACAIASGAEVIVSGDKDLIAHSGWRNVRVLRPRQFVDEFLA
jgi:putative PIN family toxin of toxin-antitoxin system